MKSYSPKKSRSFKLSFCIFYLILVAMILSVARSVFVYSLSKDAFIFQTIYYFIFAFMLFLITGIIAWSNENQKTIKAWYVAFGFTAWGIFVLLLMVGALALITYMTTKKITLPNERFDFFTVSFAMFSGITISALRWKYYLYYLALKKEASEYEPIGIDD